MPADLPDIFAFTNVPDLLAACLGLREGAPPTAMAEWLAEDLEVSTEQIFNLQSGSRKVQLDQVEIISRVMKLSEEGKEYLRRLVVMQNADTDGLKAARLSVWEMHAAHRGIPAEAVAAIFSREHVHGAEEGALLPALTVLHSLSGSWDPRLLGPMLVTPPDPARLRAACSLAAEGTTLGRWLSPRLFAIDPPGGPDALSTATWHGIFDQVRESVHRVPVGERAAVSITWNADEIAARAAERALGGLERDFRAILSRTGESAVTRLYSAVTSHMVLTDFVSRDCPAVETRASVLPVQREWSRTPLGSRHLPSSPDGRPCIYASLRFADFAQPWIQWQKGLGKQASAAILAKRMGVSRSLANNISNGTTELRPEHVQKVIAAYGLSDDDGAYAEGLARYAVATDARDRARERRALLDFAAARGVRTPESEEWRVSSYWGARAVWALGFLPFFRPNAAWVYLALRGRVPLDLAVELEHALLATGLWVKSPSGLVRPATELVRLDRLDTTVAGIAANSCHDSLCRMLQHELAFPWPGQQRRAWVLALPDAAVPMMRTRLEAFWAQISGLGVAAQERAARGETTLDRLLLTCFDFFPLTRRLSMTLSPEVRRR